MGSKDQTLPPKEANLCRAIAKHYETKQYKKGLKAADQVLKKFPDHGETLAMKGLTLNCIERKEEAYEMVRKGLKNDLRSYVCWHVYGLLYRSDRNYDEAIKCYKNALRLDKENQQILRDLALLQVQMRDLAGFVETRHMLLQLKPSNRNNWIAYAVAHHLAGHHQVAVQVLDAYSNTLAEVSDSEAYEHSELLLYKALILEEGGEAREALGHLDAHVEAVRDKVGLLEARGRLLLAVEERKEAEGVYRKLLRMCPDNYRYHEGLQAALGLRPGSGGGLTDEQRSRLAAEYEGLATEFPRAAAVKRIPLDFKVGADFDAALDAFVRPYLRRGIPSLFMELKPLYSDPAKREAIGKLFDGLRASLEGSGSFPPPAQQQLNGGGNGGGGEDGGAESPQTLVWTLFYLAQHFDALGDTGRALELIDKCIEHTPTLIELYSAKSKILKHAGDPAGACALADKARSLDLADRYLNSIAVKRHFRAGDAEGADRLAGMFTRDGEQGAAALVDMQAMWYEIEAGNMHRRKKEWGMALKRLLCVPKHFDDFVEDQFDFHSYCVRKMTLRAYVGMLAMADKVYAHRYYLKAALAAIDVYLQLYDAPQQSKGAAADAAEEEGLSPEERKRLRQKRKKEAARQAKEAEEREKAAAAAAKEREAKEKAGGKKADAAVKRDKDNDPSGQQLAATPDPLGEATSLVDMLKKHCGDNLQVHVAAFEVYIRKGRLLLALQAVKRARQLAGAPDPDAHRLLVRFCHTLSQATAASPAQQQQQRAASGAAAAGPGSAQQQGGKAAAGSQQDPRRYSLEAPPPVVQQVIDAQVEDLLEGCPDVRQYHQRWAKRVAGEAGGGTLTQRSAAAEMGVLLQPESKEKAIQELTEVDLKTLSPVPSHAECEAVLELLRGSGGAGGGGPLADAAAAERWQSKCGQQLFRWSLVFGGPAWVDHAAKMDAATAASSEAGKANGTVEGIAGLKLSA